MFTILLQFSDGREVMESTDEAIGYRRSPDGGTLSVNDVDYQIAKGDNVFVMNADGQTVRRYKP